MNELRLNIFTKMLLIILLLLIPIVLLYSYSNRVAVNVLQEKIETSQYEQFQFFLNQLTNQIDAVANNAVVLSRDSTIRELQFIDKYEPSSSIQIKKLITSKLSLQAATSIWIDKLAVHSPQSQEIVAIPTEYPTSYHVETGEQWQSVIPTGWQYSKSEEGLEQFTWFTVYPFNAYQDPTKAKIIIETGINADTIIAFLESYQETRQSNPFLYHPQYGIIATDSTDNDMIQGIVADNSSMSYYKGHLVMKMQSNWMGWTVVDYVPLKQILAPIKVTNTWFYASIGMLLVLSVAAAFLLYRNVRLPLKDLVRSLQRMKRGDFSTRIEKLPNNEFRFVMQRFNDMVAQIEQLIEKVYLEQIRARDAELKQLQSQINPHFFYNCLHFIKNMSILRDEKAVIAMTVNLGKYFRYITRLENNSALLRNEIDLIKNYLSIQKLRMPRIDYTIEIPQEMMELEVPRLILQPIVENAVVHGLEPSGENGHIHISGEKHGSSFRITVTDNGIGVTDEKLNSFQLSLDKPMHEEMGFGVWNVHQRLKYQYAKGSGIRLAHAQSGGLSVTLEFLNS